MIPPLAPAQKRLVIQFLIAIPVVGLNMVASQWLQRNTGMYGTSLMIAELGIISWWQGRVVAIWYLGLLAMGLAYFLFEGEGFAVNKSTDAFLLVTTMAGSTAVIHMVGHLHHQLKQLRITLAKLHEDCADGDTMLVEITHRVGNDLATLSAIANLQAAATTDPATVGALQSLRNRIHVFASLYRKLSGGIKDLSTAKFLEDICHDLSKAHLGLRPIDIVVNVEPVVLKPHHAVIVGILVNESVTNALKYAFPENLGGTITVGLRHDVALRELVLTVSDNGAGFVEQPSAGMGQRIMRAMSSQLHGTFALERINDLTVATVRFPES